MAVIWWGVAALGVLVALVVLFGVSTLCENRKIGGLASRIIFLKKGFYTHNSKVIYYISISNVYITDVQVVLNKSIGGIDMSKRERVEELLRLWRIADELTKENTKIVNLLGGKEDESFVGDVYDWVLDQFKVDEDKGFFDDDEAYVYQYLTEGNVDKLIEYVK